MVILLPGNANKDLPKGIKIPPLPLGERVGVRGGGAAMREAVRVASENATRGDVVLLSPGLSWLPVMNEFERGDEFVKWVKFDIRK